MSYGIFYSDWVQYFVTFVAYEFDAAADLAYKG
ncbi:hypothetical protein PEC301937_35940 [Pectobacterium carotovorum subsp. carotovorum]|nr:hypothetical protein PEC301937_35940 [Pectobacterium carotovorum subsp. carotovorum]